ncbi:ERCC4 domain-containing protein [Ruminococcus sp. OA3]|uniref:ERCC4 domain-containing protein n=1 Tax=Ruminococcus sp. OA3 TaxID=2914164 RepID=UPI001F06B394|nr:ERCC4 domain-containing protein [Ruminococcus sp. OA3]MCH1984183.1 ERCC4 domain-containing protein [Ruminococcus sp. OA3]
MGNYTELEINEIMKTMVVLVDTREQPTPRYYHRIRQFQFPYRRQKLEFGDYSCECTLPGGDVLDFSSHVSVERKQDIEELCMCFGTQRKRFEKEFERARQREARLYLLTEHPDPKETRNDVGWPQVFNGSYDSRLPSKSLLASILAWGARYNMVFQFACWKYSGQLIENILYRELKEYLRNQEAGD